MPGWAHLSIIAVVLHTFVDSNVAARAVFPHVEAGALARRNPLKVDHSFAAAIGRWLSRTVAAGVVPLLCSACIIKVLSGTYP